jgi:intracellular septation protein
MIFGVGEIAYEWIRLRKVDPFTWAGNGMLLILGGISLFTNQGIWFKLQPSIIEAAMAIVFCGSVVLKRPLMAGLLKKQLAAAARASAPPGVQAPSGAPAPELAPWLIPLLGGVTFRFGLFFGAHAALAACAALHWSTAAWAALKGIGFTGTFLLYGLVEAACLRRRIQVYVRESSR